MKFAKLNLSTSNYSDPDFLSKTRYVLASLTGNPAFLNPVPPLKELSKAIDNFDKLLVGASSGTHALVGAKNQARKTLEALYIQLGLFVMYIAQGNVSMLISSGYTLSKDPEPSYISNPGNVTLTNGVTSGDLQSSVSSVKGSKMYLHQITDNEPSENTIWETRTCSRSKYTFKGLVAGKKYWVRVAATGSHDQIAYSTIASQFVL